MQSGMRGGDGAELHWQDVQYPRCGEEGEGPAEATRFGRQELQVSMAAGVGKLIQKPKDYRVSEASEGKQLSVRHW